MRRKARPVLALILVVLVSFSLSDTGHGQVRHAKPGDRVDRFTLPDIDGNTITSDGLRGRVWFLTFLTAHQKRSERALADLADLVSNRREAGHLVDLLIVINGGDGLDFFRRKREGLPPGSKILIDPDDALWGRLGVVVTPTSLLIDPEGTIRWFRAGHSFDFTTMARQSLDLALGLAEPPAQADAEPDPSPATVSERAWRHLRMAQVLARRGEIRSAITEIRKARDLTPDAFAIQAELTHLLCRDGQADAALAVADGLRPSTPPERAQVAMLTGWAHRQRGDLDRALALLNDAVALDPDSGRALYELGKVFEQQGDCRRALDLYRRALDVRFGEMRPPLPSS